jgi:hypothetical protein
MMLLGFAETAGVTGIFGGVITLGVGLGVTSFSFLQDVVATAKITAIIAIIILFIVVLIVFNFLFVY